MRRSPSVWAGAGPVATTPVRNRPATGLGGSGFAIWSLTGLAVYDLVHLWAGLDYMFLLEWVHYVLMRSCLSSGWADFSRVVRLSGFGRFSPPGEGWSLIDG